MDLRVLKYLALIFSTLFVSTAPVSANTGQPLLNIALASGAHTPHSAAAYLDIRTAHLADDQHDRIRGPNTTGVFMPSQFSCPGIRFFQSAGVGTEFREGASHQGGTFVSIENHHFMKVREPVPGLIVAVFPQGYALGDQASIVFDQQIRVVGILWYDNDPNPGEAGWSLNSIAGPLTGNTGAEWTTVDLLTKEIHISAGGDSGGIDFCFQQVQGQPPTETPPPATPTQALPPATPTQAASPTPTQAASPTPTQALPPATPTQTPSSTPTQAASPTPSPSPTFPPQLPPVLPPSGVEQVPAAGDGRAPHVGAQGPATLPNTSADSHQTLFLLVAALCLISIGVMLRRYLLRSD